MGLLLRGRWIELGPGGSAGGLATAELGQGAVELAVEHGLVTDDPG